MDRRIETLEGEGVRNEEEFDHKKTDRLTVGVVQVFYMGLKCPSICK